MLCFRNFPEAKKFMDKREGKCPDSPSIFSGLTMPKKFVGQPFRVSLNSGIEKLYASEGYVTISVEVFLSDNAEKFCRGTLLCCFRKIPAAKKFTDKREGGGSRFSGENFLSHSAEKVRRATL